MQNSFPRYIQVYEHLKSQIEQGCYPLHTFLPSERTLSELYGVERMTLRKSLALLASEGYVSKIHGSGNKITYLPTAPTSPCSIVYALPDMPGGQVAQPYHLEICSHLEQYCKSKNLNLIFSKVSNEQSIPPFLTVSENIKGIIWVSSINTKFLDYAKDKQIPSIVIANDYPHFSKININDILCSYTATSHLIHKGCTRIVHITGLEGSINTHQRLEGYKLALSTANLSFSEKLILKGDWNFSSSYENVLKLIYSGISFDGIVAANDMMALGALKAVLTAGLSVPHDIKIIGIDNISQSAMSTPSLSTIWVPQKDIALTAFMFLMNQLEGLDIPDEILIPGKLLERETT